MDAHQAVGSYDAFDALLDASSLGAPRVQAVRRHTPAAVRELLASRLTRRTLPAPGAPGRRITPPQRVMESAPAQPPLQQPGGQPDLVHAPQGCSRSQEFFHVGFDSMQIVKLIFIDSPNREKILQSVRNLMEYAAAPAWRDIYTSGILQSFVHGSEGDCDSPEEGIKTRLFVQPFFSGEGGGYGLIGRYGTGLNIASASIYPSVKPWSSYGLSGQILRNIEFLDAGSNSRVLASRRNPPGRPPLDAFIGRWAANWPEAVVHDCRCWVHSTERWRDLRADVSGCPAHGISTQAGRRAMDHVLCTATDHLTHLCSASWWLRTDHDTGRQAPLLSSFALSLWGNQRGRSHAGPGTAGPAGRYLWPDHFTVCPQGAPEDPHTARDGERILYLPPAGPALVRLGGQAAEMYQSGGPAALEERQALKGTCAAFGPGQGIGERWSTLQYATWGRISAGEYLWSDYFTATTLAHEMIMAVRAVKPLWNELGESSSENSPVPLPAALKLLRPAPAGSTAFRTHLNATLPYRIEATKKATAVQAVAELILHEDGNPVSVVLTCCSDTPSIVHAVFEGMSGEQTGWIFARDPLVGGAKSSSDFRDVLTGVPNEQLNDWVNLCVCIRLSGTEGEAVLQIRKADLARFLDSARDVGSNEHHRLPTVLDTVPEELLSDARPR
ncbi:SsgA family sporulation/cell division regulator [Streptomyces griseoviridis]|uniref:SsgA family sporulation/cell division regulator n=1 Tax=Streptomyces griseoviridis TaxID=45398 RepID=UPI0033C6B8EE